MVWEEEEGTSGRHIANSKLTSCCSVAQSCPTLQLHGLQHTRLPCLSPSPKVCPSLFTESVMPTPISPSLTLFFCLQSFPASGSSPMSWLFTSCSQKIGASASASVLPMSIQGWFPLRLTGLISLLSKGLSRVFSSITVWKHQFFGALPSLWSNSHIRTWPLERPQPWLVTLSAKCCLCYLICYLGLS